MSEDLKAWIGRIETRQEKITPWPMAALSATLDRNDPFPEAGDPVPPLWHWLWFLPLTRQSELGPDGHAKLGGFLPPVSLPRRMWAGSYCRFHHPLRIGDSALRTSRIVNVQEKEGRTGPLVFVRVTHEVAADGKVLLAEDQDIVYAGHSRPGSSAAPARQPAPATWDWERVVRPDDVLLFRYSALTFNGHRIHYDRRHATEEEGYPGLVVHGPLIATLLLDLLRSNVPDAVVGEFTFRAMSPLFDTSPFFIRGKRDQSEETIQLWAADSGGLAMNASAKVSIAPPGQEGWLRP